MDSMRYQNVLAGLEEAYLGGGGGLPAMAHLGPATDDAMMCYSANELNDPEYSSDEFRMFSFKVARCSKRYVHDWRSCPFAHPTENARRRDPRVTNYLPVPCPDYKRGICMRGDVCPYSHGVYECWLHPAKYRTQLCKEGPNCRRPVCFFAHSVCDLRQPTHLWAEGGEPEMGGNGRASPATTAAGMLLRQPSDGMMTNSNGGGSSTDGQGSSMEGGHQPSQKRSESDAARRSFQTAAEEAFNNNMQEDQSMHSVHSSASALNASSCGTGTASSNASAHNQNMAPSSLLGAGAGQQFSDSPADGSISDGSGAGCDDSPSTPPLDAAGDHQAWSSNATLNAGAATGGAGEPLTIAETLTPTASDGLTPLAGAGGEFSSAPTAGADGGAADGTSPKGSNQNWSQSLAASASAAAAMSGIPINEQPMLANHGPRMSNAVARKLGLAPQKPPPGAAAAVATVATATRAVRNGVASPMRGSLDASATTPFATAAAQQQQQQRASLDEIRLSQAAALAGFGGQMQAPVAMASAGNPYAASVFPGAAAYSASYPGADALGIHPAILNLVAANIAVGGASNNGQGTGAGGQGMQMHHASMYQQHAQQQQQQQQMFAAHGFTTQGSGGSGMYGMGDDTSGVASLLGPLSQWGLKGGDAEAANNAPMSFPHRGSSEGMLGSTGLPQGPNLHQSPFRPQQGRGH